MNFIARERSITPIGAGPRGPSDGDPPRPTLTSLERRRWELAATTPAGEPRLAQLRASLPLTCRLLGDELKSMAPRRAAPWDLPGFAAEVRARLADGWPAHRWLLDVLAYELAASEAWRAPACDVGQPPAVGDCVATHPQIRVLRMTLDPLALLCSLLDGWLDAPDVQADEHWLLLDGRRAELRVRSVPERVARDLLTATQGEVAFAPSLRALADSGLLVRAR